MESNPNLFSPSASSFLTAPSVVGVMSSSPAEPNSPLSSSGSNGIIAVDSERWTSSDYSDFTSMSAVSSAAPTIISVNSSMPGTSVPTAPQSPEAVNDNVFTDGTSIDTIRLEPSWQTREETTPSNAVPFSLLRYLSAHPAQSRSGPDSFGSFEFPSLEHGASSATQQQPDQQRPSSFTNQHSALTPSTMQAAPFAPQMDSSSSPPATVSTALLDDSRQPSPESVERVAADLMAFSVSSTSSKELAEQQFPTKLASSTATSTLTSSPPTPTNANTNATPAYEWAVTASPEPLTESESTSVRGSGVHTTSTLIPHNATTASGGFSCATTKRWPWMDVVDDLFPAHDLDPPRYDGAPLPHIMHVPPRVLEVDAQQPSNKTLFGQFGSSLNVMGPSTNDNIASQQPSIDPHICSFAFTTDMTSTSQPPNASFPSAPLLGQDWAQEYSVPMRPLYDPPGTGAVGSHSRSFDFRLVEDDAAARVSGLVSTQPAQSSPLPPAWGSLGDAFLPKQDEGAPSHPRLPYRVPSPRTRTPTPTFTSGSQAASFGCNLFAPPSPSSEAETEDSFADSVYGLKDVQGRAPSNDRELQGNESTKGKGGLALNTEEARKAYEKAVHARMRFQYPALPPGVLPSSDGEKAYQEAIQARDRRIRPPASSSIHVLHSSTDRDAVPSDDDTNHSSPISAVPTIRPHFEPTSPKLQSVSGLSHTTVVSEQYTAAQSPAASLEAIPIIPDDNSSAQERQYIRRRSTPGLEYVKENERDWRHVERRKLEAEKQRLLKETKRLGAKQNELIEREREMGLRQTAEASRWETMFSRPNFPTSRQTSPFIPPSRASSSSSLYVTAPAAPLQCHPAPSSRSSTPSSPPFQHRRQLRRIASNHTTSGPAVTFALPGASTTSNTGPSYTSSTRDTGNPLRSFQSTYPGMNSGKLSTLNFNESTRPSPWVSTPRFSDTPGPTNTAHEDTQQWPFAPLPNVQQTPAQWPWPTTPGQQPSQGWQQASSAWGQSWFNVNPYPGYTPNPSFPPLAPFMSNATLPSSTSGTTGRNTSLPFTQPTALPTYPLPTGQYTGNPGAHSRWVPPPIGLQSQHVEPYAPRSAPPPYYGSPNRWGNVPGGMAPGMNGYTLHFKYCFSDANVSFLVENVEYRVHRYFFEKHSNLMKLILAPYPLCNVEPIPLMVYAADFDKLLSIFYPTDPLHPDKLATTEEFRGVIRVCGELGFEEIRKSVIELASKANPVERILLSREPGINLKDLATSAYEELCTSGKPVSPEDGEKLGAATVIKIWEVQQVLSAQDFCRPGCRKDFLEATIKQKFGLA